MGGQDDVGLAKANSLGLSVPVLSCLFCFFCNSGNIALNDYQEGGAVATKAKSGGRAEVKFYTYTYIYMHIHSTLLILHVRVIVHLLSVECSGG